MFKNNSNILKLYQNNLKKKLVDKNQNSNKTKRKGLNLLAKKKIIYVVLEMTINQFIAGEEQKLKIF